MLQKSVKISFYVLFNKLKLIDDSNNNIKKLNQVQFQNK